ncbi:tryptophan synthase subunit alpha [Candidatus Woesearchaeota archaeon]|nr:tryptophan synthase subunit alpha [Candidatus Woesearchaeota archaeon]
MRFGSNFVMPFLVLGDPNYSTSLKLLRIAAESGANALELGFAFSDPIADGPIIQAANYRALSSGITTEKSFMLLKELRKHSDIPISIMVSMNMVFRYGIAKFYNKCKTLGIDAVLCPDCPLEEIGELLAESKKNKIYQVFMVAPSTSSKRLAEISKHASGYIYLVTVRGTTGIRKSISKEVAGLIKKTKSSINLPVYVGFGISSRQHVKQVIEMGADGAICGSAIVKMIKAKNPPLEKVRKFIKSLSLD